jgi:general transcription factor 3C polypeptide 3 (transcription factor C subunit 4)
MQFFEDALHFYQPLRNMPDQVDGLLLVRMGKCFLHGKRDQQAEECFRVALEFDRDDIDACMELARLYERTGRPEQALDYVSDVMLLRKSQDPKIRHKPSRRTESRTSSEKSSTITKTPKPRLKRPKQQGKKKHTKAETAERLQSQYFILREECEGMRIGDAASVDAWMDAARDLTDDFRGFKPFFPLDKYLKFLGYSSDSSSQAGTSLDLDLTAMAERLSKGLCWNSPVSKIR